MLQSKPWNIATVPIIRCLSVNGHIVHTSQFGIQLNITTFDVPKQASEEDIKEMLCYAFKVADLWPIYISHSMTILRWINKYALKIKLQRLVDCSISLRLLTQTKWTLESLPAACDALYTAVTNSLSDSQIVNYINDQLGDLQ